MGTLRQSLTAAGVSGLAVSAWLALHLITGPISLPGAQVPSVQVVVVEEESEEIVASLVAAGAQSVHSTSGMALSAEAEPLSGEPGGWLLHEAARPELIGAALSLTPTQVAELPEGFLQGYMAIVGEGSQVEAVALAAGHELGLWRRSSPVGTAALVLVLGWLLAAARHRWGRPVAWTAAALLTALWWSAGFVLWWGGLWLSPAAIVCAGAPLLGRWGAVPARKAAAPSLAPINVG